MEIWKDIEGYEGFYQISSMGKVKALERVILNKNGKPQRYPEKMLIPEVFDRKSSKYCRVALSKDHKVKRFLVHRLVASAFIPNPLNKEFVNHIDNNGENNSLDNL